MLVCVCVCGFYIQQQCCSSSHLQRERRRVVPRSCTCECAMDMENREARFLVYIRASLFVCCAVRRRRVLDVSKVHRGKCKCERGSEARESTYKVQQTKESCVVIIICILLCALFYICVYVILHFI